MNNNILPFATLGLVVAFLLFMSNGNDPAEDRDKIAGRLPPSIIPISAGFEPLISTFKALPPEKTADIRDFYTIFADIIERDSAKVISNSAKFRKYNSLTLQLAYQNTNPPPEEKANLDILKAQIETTLQQEGGISLSPGNIISPEKVSETLKGIAWAAQQALN